ncbi:lectin [Actinospica robiniae]|uniref:lectin n=1 Tax=Actinospica robiniae TaxID=304901 RepID=UPI00040101B7|nr:lectin [Actinospica robiniae]
MRSVPWGLVPRRLRAGKTLRVTVVAALVSAAACLPALTPSAQAAALVSNPASLVNPFIGTTNGGNDFPGADAPFGMVQWSPDTTSSPAGGGYSYNDSSITGFSLTHISGPGCGAGGDIPILPTTGAINGSATDAFSHSNESASAGLYSVTLGNGVGVKLTATPRTGLGQFTFPSTTQANLLFKMNSSQNGTSNQHFTVVSNTEVTGQVTDGHFCGAGNTYTVYFDMKFNTPFSSSGTFSGGDYLTFNTTSTATVLAKVGLSYVSVANATGNLTAEDSGFNFATTQAAAQSSWNSTLGKIQIAGGTAAQQTVFYSALYHALLHPNIISDTNGQYFGFDGKTHTVDSGHSAAYANYSGWDIYRSQAQLEALVAPSVASDTAQSMIDDYSQTGQFPKWSEDNGESYVMVGDPADEILADYYAFGARSFDTATALTDMVAEAKNTNNNRPGLNYITGSPGYLPSDGSYGCCNFYGPSSTQLEYDSADYAIASFAQQLGNTADYTTFATRAQNWQSIFNPASGFMQPKLLNGSWSPVFDATSGTDFVEGTSWQYTGMVPFNIAGLAQADGGNAHYNSSYLNQVLAGFGGANGSQADLGNEPSLELPWEYDYTGEPYQTQHVVREVQDQIWTNTPGGLAGNDDLGEMSSWFVWSALGMYPETPGTSALALGSSLFTQSVVTLPSGNTLTINGTNAADNAPYVQSATWNGAAWNNAYAPTSAITAGGTFTDVLGTSANTGWAAAANEAPPSDSTGSRIAVTSTSPASGLVIAPGATGTGAVDATNLTGSAITVTWTASAPSGVAISPTSGSFSVPADSAGSQSVTVTAGQTEGSYPITFTLASGGTSLPAASLNVAVAKAGELPPYYTNAGISADTNQSAANYDGAGYSYSATALGNAGLKPGGTVTSDGVSYTWPSAAAGQLDNIEASGQKIAEPDISGATKIGLLGSATNAGSGGSTGTLTVTYTDGTTQQISVDFGDWTLGAGAYTAPSSDQTVATTTYRNAGGSSQTVNTYVFATDAALTSGKTGGSVTLPTAGGGDFHVFAIGFAGGSGSTPPPTGSTGPIVSGVSSSLCVDDNGGSTTNGSHVQIWTCNGTAAQQWTVESNGTLQVLGGCLDASNSGTTNGTVVQYWTCNGTGAQQWTEGANGSLINTNSGLCLDDPGSSTTAGTQLQLYTCNGTNAQNWTLP